MKRRIVAVLVRAVAANAEPNTASSALDTVSMIEVRVRLTARTYQ